MSSQLQFTLNEALQLTAFLPCIFLTIYLLSCTKNKKKAIIPSLYFISLGSGLLYRLMPVLSFLPQEHPNIVFVLILFDSMISAFSFLLILQMTLNRVPQLLFWGILLVPLFATSPFIYAFTNNIIACTSSNDFCFSSESLLHLNMAVASSFILLLLTVIFSRISLEIEGDAIIRKHKYWLVISIIIFNIILIGIEIGFTIEFIDIQRYIFSKVMVKIAFIYVVMTSIFRVFNDQFEVNTVAIAIGKQELTEYEKSVGIRAEKLLSTENIYRETGFNRASFAKRLSVREHVLSRIINMHFNKSFSELANEFRIKEAKELLSKKELSVTNIAYDVGFSSITSFNRVFKEITGCSPSEFRDEAVKKNITG